MIGSYFWAAVAYGLLALLGTFVVTVIILMVLASKRDRTSIGLPQLNVVASKDDEEEFFFEGGLEQQKTELSTASKKPVTKSFFRKNDSATATSGASKVKEDSELPFFEEDDFDLTDGSDVTPSSR